eukprot:CAMPEP_0114598780 /NCGR_PEP_ID=MMETSP0125-20121206/21183_1 /TAXON_ID=485358 ORGANISM="Aristerostoma sp., Strain ATCC 50986" /NCGR_SAMPLE_ID=MMETSP0125 /ASSEMBLY_ACC=CAM_ASM_000245 /LENGTH=120 /DNA_ID=CAMNT_0001804919 /DNA_START=286 /DNA_END=648 /DNA_ORIENTATION=+
MVIELKENDLERELDTDMLAKTHILRSTVEPEVFSGVLFKEKGIVCTIEKNGKMYLSGAKSSAQADEFMLKIRQIVVENDEAIRRREEMWNNLDMSSPSENQDVFDYNIAEIPEILEKGF